MVAPLASDSVPQKLIPVRRGPPPCQVPRGLNDFRVVEPAELSVRGAAPKWIIRNTQRSTDFFIAKRAEKFGETETYTEFFLNRLGHRLGFDMAPGGLIHIGDILHFASRSFLGPGESLVHASVIAQQFWEEKEIKRIGRKDEQRFYTIDLIVDMLRQFCGKSFALVLEKFINMLVFDAAIGSMDRHIQNWGVIVTTEKPQQIRFAPIFDTARALLWNQNEDGLARLMRHPQSFEAYVRKASPTIGVLKCKGKTRYFDLVQCLLKDFPVQTRRALKRAAVTVVTKKISTNVLKTLKLEVVAAELLTDYPFFKTFSQERKRLIIEVLRARARILDALMTEATGA